MSSAIAHRLQGLLAAIERELDRSGVPGEITATIYIRGSDVVRIGARELGLRENRKTGHLASSQDDRVRLVVPGTNEPLLLSPGKAIPNTLRLVPAPDDGGEGAPF